MFEIHPKLKEDCIKLGRFNLCRLLLINDSNFPWFILVPEREKIREIFELSAKDQIELIYESSFLAKKLFTAFSADKMNVAALGNMVPQLHLHHIVRYKNDPAWPGPVWGKTAPKKYSEKDLSEVIKKLKDLLETPDFVWEENLIKT